MPFFSFFLVIFFIRPIRFFFKTRCDDDENPIIQEEICNDAEVLPLFEGKVMATVKPAN